MPDTLISYPLVRKKTNGLKPLIFQGFKPFFTYFTVKNRIIHPKFLFFNQKIEFVIEISNIIYFLIQKLLQSFSVPLNINLEHLHILIPFACIQSICRQAHLLDQQIIRAQHLQCHVVNRFHIHVCLYL